jgi:hypothetical protein
MRATCPANFILLAFKALSRRMNISQSYVGVMFTFYEIVTFEICTCFYSSGSEGGRPYVLSKSATLCPKPGANTDRL